MSGVPRNIGWWAAAAALAGFAWMAEIGRSADSAAEERTPQAQGFGMQHDPVRSADATATSAKTEADASARRTQWPIERAELLREGLAARPGERTTDLFAAAQWRAPHTPRTPAPVLGPAAAAASKPAALPAAAPQAAPSRLQFQGKQWDERGWQVFLLRGDQTLIVREGQSIDNDYRVLAIKPPRMTLQHLARGESIEIPIGEAQ